MRPNENKSSLKASAAYSPEIEWKLHEITLNKVESKQLRYKEQLETDYQFTSALSIFAFITFFGILLGDSAPMKILYILIGWHKIH
jgi:hypothetical protein